MYRLPPRFTRTDTLFPYTTRFRSTLRLTGFVASGIALTFSPLYAGSGLARLWSTGFDVPVGWALLVGPILALLALAGLVAVAILHGVLARQIGRAHV